MIERPPWAVEAGSAVRLVYWMIARDGSVRLFLDPAAAVPAGSCTAGLRHGFLLDIPEQKELEVALRAREAELGRQSTRYRSLVVLGPTVIVTTDVEHRVISVVGKQCGVMRRGRRWGVGRSCGRRVAVSGVGGGGCGRGLRVPRGPSGAC